MALAISAPRLPPAVTTMFQSVSSASPGGAFAAIQSWSSARYCAISGPRSSSMKARLALVYCAGLLALAGVDSHPARLAALGADGEVLERDVAVGPRLLGQPEDPLADDAALDLVGAAGDRGARAGQRPVPDLAAALDRRLLQHALSAEDGHAGVAAR